jgi:sugar O-acyltransferase (sialic acid O-acetyltransferase NeuD family)
MVSSGAHPGPGAEPGDAVRRLLIVGAGGFGRETVEAVRAINVERPTWELLGFLDDNPALQGHELDGIPVLGMLSAVERFPDALLVVTVGRPENYIARKQIVRRLDLEPTRYATIVHPTAVLPSRTSIGPGTVLLASVVVTTGIRIGAHVVVMPGVVLTHDDEIADFVTLGAGVRLAGGVLVEEGAYVGAGALVRENRTVGRWSLLGMGAVVTNNVPPGEVWAGVPARFVRRVDHQAGQPGSDLPSYPVGADT